MLINTNSVDAHYGYKTELSLAMKKIRNSRGMISWVDMGVEFDDYQCDFSFSNLAEVQDNIEAIVKSVDDIEFSSISDFYPFTPAFNYGSGLDIAIKKTGNIKAIDPLNKAYKSTWKIVPAMTDVAATLGSATEIVDEFRSPEHWALGGTVLLPSPVKGYSAAINNNRSAMLLHGSYYDARTTTEDEGEITKISVILDEDTARRFILYIIGVRGGTMSSVFPTGHHPFGRSYDGMTNFNTVLADKVIKCTHADYRKYIVEFNLQVVSAS